MLVPTIPDVQHRDYVSRARVSEDSVIWSGIVWIIRYPLGSKGAVRLSFTWVDRNRWLPLWRISEQGACGTTGSDQINIFWSHSLSHSPEILEVVLRGMHDSGTNFPIFCILSFYLFY